MKEAIIAFSHYQEALSVYKASAGRQGRGLYNDMKRLYQEQKDEFESQMNSLSEQEFEAAMLIWNTKVPLSSIRRYVNGKKEY